MIQKFLSPLSIIRSCTCTCFGLFDLAEFFNQTWTISEMLLVAVVALWIPVIKLSAFLFNVFGIRSVLILRMKHYRVVLITLFVVTFLATVFNLIEKYHHGYSLHNLLVLSVVNAFILIMDYLETRELIRKIKMRNSGMI